MKVVAPSLAPVLRSDTQGRILARLLVDVTQEHSLSELADWADTSFPTALREVRRAERAGIVLTWKVGNTRLTRANVAHPLHRALRELIVATYGPPSVIAQEFGALEDVQAVLLFGSWAARYLGDPGSPPNDIDVLVIGDPERRAVEDAAERAEETIGMPVQATIRSPRQWREATEGFIAEVKIRPLVPLLLDPDDPDLAAELTRLGSRGR